MATNTWQNGSTYNDRYYNAFSYDANGNILTQVRHNEAGTRVENLSYKYERDANGRLLRNRLYHVNETVSAGAFADDIDDQGVFTTSNINVNNNYGYDEEGRLVRDDAEDIAQIKWTVTSKVKEVIRSNGSPKKNLKFDYACPERRRSRRDASGKRIAKHVYSSSNVWEKSSYYTYDATGNVMAVYEKVSTDPDDPSMITYHVIERHMYGSSRIGSNNLKFELSGTTSIPDTGNYVHIIGKKQYEYSNHLGNVLATTSDKLIAKDWNNDNTVDSYKAEILSATDYTPFGVAMDGRTFTADKARYGFNGKEKDNEWNVDGGSYDFGARMYDSRLGRFLSVDPMVHTMAYFGCYTYAANSPIYNIDVDGENPTPGPGGGYRRSNNNYYRYSPFITYNQPAYQIYRSTTFVQPRAPNAVPASPANLQCAPPATPQIRSGSAVDGGPVVPPENCTPVIVLNVADAASSYLKVVNAKMTGSTSQHAPTKVLGLNITLTEVHYSKVTRDGYVLGTNTQIVVSGPDALVFNELQLNWEKAINAYVNKSVNDAMTKAYFAENPNSPRVAMPSFTPEQVSKWKTDNKSLVDLYNTAARVYLGPSPREQVKKEFEKLRSSGKLVPGTTINDKQGFIMQN